MDILGSIMKKMEVPPAMDETERKRREKQKETMKREQEEKERRVKEFRKNIQDRISRFSGDDAQLRLVFETMDKFSRTILHDIAETAGLLAHSFGTEEVDRHVIVFKPEGMPSEPELTALKRGEPYDPTWECQPDEHEDEEGGGGNRAGGKATEDFIPTAASSRGKKRKQPPEYLQKYEKHLGGLGVAKEDAKSTKTTRNYGFVNSDLKKDKRTIEETLADIRARKLQKVSEGEGDLSD